jgi:excisionase family DNA binding protein
MIVVTGLIGINEATRITGLAKGTLYNLTAAGVVPHYKLGRRTLFRAEELEAWIEQHRRGPIVPSSPSDERQEERR